MGPLTLPSLDEVRRARERLLPHVLRTPLLPCPALGGARAARAHLKCENLQRAGSFKIRGALNAMLRAQARGEIGKAGVITYSSGNHGQAVALAARILECPAIVVVPEDVAAVKRAAIEGFGARVVPCGLTSDDRHDGALRIAAETGAAVIPPYDHPDIIAGQGTIALEVIEDLPSAAAILVPVGGGGLIAGISIAARALKPDVRVLAVEPATSNDLALSLVAGKRVRIPPSSTIADGLRALTPGELTFEAIRKHVESVLCVDEASIRRAQRLLLEHAKLLVEPSGAVTAAAYVEHGGDWEAADVVLVVSGGNADFDPRRVFP
jgi:threonine dehydratase